MVPTGSGGPVRSAGQSGQVRSARPEIGRRARRSTVGDDRVDLRLGQGPLVVAQRQPVGEALLRRRRAAGPGRCRRARPRAGADRHGAGSRPRRPPPAASPRTMTARSRSTAGWRDGAVTRAAVELAAGEARDRELGDDHPLGPELERVDGPPDAARRPARRAPPPADDPGRPAGMEVRVVGQRGRRSAPASPRRAADELDEALGVVEVVRPRRPVPRRRLGRPGQREPEPPPLVGRRRRPVAP